jgi:uncharacterized protein (UPF0333 family)
MKKCSKSFRNIANKKKQYFYLAEHQFKHPALTRKVKDWLTWNEDNVSEWSDISNRGLLFQ